MTDRLLIQAVAEELGAVVGALLGASATVAPASGGAGACVFVRLAFAGSSTGSVTVGFDRAGATELTRLIMLLDEQPPDEAVADTLQEISGQALGSVSQRSEFQGIRLSEAKMLPDGPADAPATFELNAADRLTVTLALWGALDARGASKRVEAASAAAAPAPPNLDVILDIDLPLSVRFGVTEMTLHALTRLAPGSVIDLGRSPDDPVEILVNGRLVARGEVVVVAGNYGVRVTEVISAADRLKTMAA